MRQPTCEVPFATRVQASSWITEAPDWSARGELAERTSSSTLEAADRWMAVPILRSPRVEGERTLRQAVERDQSDRAALAKRRALFEAPRTSERQPGYSSPSARNDVCFA